MPLRRSLALPLVVLALSLAACTGDTDDAPAPPATATAAATAPPTATATPTPAATVTPTATSTPAATPSPTAPATPSPTPVPVTTASPTPTPEPTATPTPSTSSAAGHQPPGIEFTPLALGEPRDLPVGVALYYGEHNCEGFHDAFRVVAGQNPPDLRTDRPWAFLDDRPGYVQSYKVAPSGQSLAAVVCERGYCDWGYDQPSDDATPAAWFSPDGGTTWHRRGELPLYSSIVAVTDEDVALFDYGYRNGSDRVAPRGWWFRSGDDLTPPEGLVDPYIAGWRSGLARPEPIWSDYHSRAVVTDSGERAQPPLPAAWPARVLPDRSLLWSARGADGRDLFVTTDEHGAVLAAYSWDAERPLHLVAELGAELFVGELDRYTCSPAMTVLVDLAAATVRAVPGINPDGQRLFMLFAARPAPESPGPAATGSPTTFRYTTYDTSGEVAEPGSYTFLADPADSSSVVTTYEGLRDGTARALRIHATDADGVSRAAFLDTVEVGDLFEWRQAEDCFVRYTVTELLPDPSGTPWRLLAVEWMTYAFTGCGGPIAPEAAVTVDWGELPDLGGASLTVPVVHGIYQIVPAGWKGATVEPLVDFSGPAQPEDLRSYSTLAEARLLPYWRDPALPEAWILEDARIGFEGPRHGYCATFRTEERTWRNNEVYRNYAFDICALRVTGWYRPEIASWHDGASVRETRVVAGRAAMVIYSPEGPDSRPDFPIRIWVYDPETETDYELGAGDGSISGSNINAALAIVRGLFEPPNPP